MMEAIVGTSCRRVVYTTNLEAKFPQLQKKVYIFLTAVVSFELENCQPLAGALT